MKLNKMEAVTRKKMLNKKDKLKKIEKRKKRNKNKGEKVPLASKDVIEIETELCEENVIKDVEIVIEKEIRKRKIFVPVDRSKEIEAFRSKLPIVLEEQAIMEAITENPVVILSGETGSGKTTQVPQFLYEAGYCQKGKLIGITEPRRVAAISMSTRVGFELNLPSNIISYQIRFEGNSGSKTQIKFMTDGVLLKEMERDFLLMKYSAICIDEAHERSLYTDILIGLLSRCVRLREKKGEPLKLVIMSATMRIEDFSENKNLFPALPPVIEIPTRQFPVTIHFSKLTPTDYVEACVKKTCQIHRKLPPGGILIFVTGQQEVKTVVKKLHKIFNVKKRNKAEDDNDDNEEMGSSEEDENNEEIPSKKLKVDHKSIKYKNPKKKGKDSKKEPEEVELLDIDLNDVGDFPNNGDLSDEDEDEDLFEREGDSTGKLHLVPLYSMLPIKEQKKVFEPPPPGTRLCVVATNVAETSITISSIRYVIDCGKVKEKLWDQLTGVETFRIQWTSKASAQQRAGRSGRVGPGHTYRLFSSAVYENDFNGFSKPEIESRPIEDIVLILKAMGINKVEGFPFPTPPEKDEIRRAENLLVLLGAFEHVPIISTSGKETRTKITALGKTMARLPVSPRFGKMLAIGANHSLAELTIALVAALTVQEVFLNENEEGNSKKWGLIRRKWAGAGEHLLLGDCMVLLKAVGSFEYSGGTRDFCVNSGLRETALIEIRKLRRQLTQEMNLLTGNDLPLDPRMDPPSEEEATLLRQIFLSGFPDRIARKMTADEIGGDTQVKRSLKNAYRCGEMESPIFIDKASSLHSSSPPWIIYQEAAEKNEKINLRTITAIEPEWIPLFASSICTIEKHIKEPPPRYSNNTGTVVGILKSTYGKQGWELPYYEGELSRSLEKSRIFAEAVLQGEVFPKMKPWASLLLSQPMLLRRTWGKLQPRVEKFLQPFLDTKIDSRTSLEKKWQEDPNFLLIQFNDWIPNEYHEKIKSLWPPL